VAASGDALKEGSAFADCSGGLVGSGTGIGGDAALVSGRETAQTRLVGVSEEGMVSL
jgi:hypothetical protein